LRVLSRSVQNRLSIGIALAVAIAVGTVSLRLAGMRSPLDFSSAPVALLSSSYVPAMKMTTHGPIYALLFLGGVYSMAWLERLALSTTRGTVMLFGITAAIWAVIRGVDAWQRRDRVEVELDELVDPPTLRLGLME
jgi:hypothetical protein